MTPSQDPSTAFSYMRITFTELFAVEQRIIAKAIVNLSRHTRDYKGYNGSSR
jgi:hypothetical protein